MVERLKLPTKKLPRPINVYNADGQPNAGGPITECVMAELLVGKHREKIVLAVTDLGDGEVFLGHDWLAEHDPIIKWSEGTISFDNCLCQRRSGPDPEEESDQDTWKELEPGDSILCVDFAPTVMLRAMSTPAQRLAEEAAKAERKTVSLPSYLADYIDVFEKKEFDKLPPRRPWDHAIELIPGAKPQLACKIYPLGRVEQEELDNFLDEQLLTG